MKILTSYTDYLDRFASQIRPGCHVYIASFNLYAGVFAHGGYGNDSSNENYHSKVGKLFDYMESVNAKVELKIGVPMIIECPRDDKSLDDSKAYCQCGRSHRRKLLSIGHVMKRWPSFKWQFSKDNHTKLAFVSNKTAFFGGMNFSDSSMQDMMVETHDVNFIRDLFSTYERITTNSFNDSVVVSGGCNEKVLASVKPMDHLVLKSSDLMPFGKFKGQPMAVINQEYMCYLIAQGLADGNVKNYFLKVLNP